jgi:hypothetical protein
MTRPGRYVDAEDLEHPKADGAIGEYHTVNLGPDVFTVCTTAAALNIAHQWRDLAAELADRDAQRTGQRSPWDEVV